VLSLAGAAIGLTAAWGAARLVAGLLFALDPHDPAAFVIAPAVLVVVALAASLVPSLRAATVDPLTALRGSHD